MHTTWHSQTKRVQYFSLVLGSMRLVSNGLPPAPVVHFDGIAPLSTLWILVVVSTHLTFSFARSFCSCQ